MAGEWKEKSLFSLIDIKHGYAFSGESIHEEPIGDILLTPGNFAIGGGFKGNKFKYFVGNVPEEFVLKEGDLLITMTDLSKQTDTLGYPAFVPKSHSARFLHNQRLGKVIIRSDAELDKSFLFYLLRTAKYRNEILASATGTTVKHTSPNRILAYKTKFPLVDEQRAIAHILGTLDDKIELNRKMNETLEAMARAIFKSWFIDFDPVHAKAEGRDPKLPKEIADLFPDSFQDSELGKIPKGWRVVLMPETIDINPIRSLQKGTNAPYLDMANVQNNSARVNKVIKRPFGSGIKFMNGDTLLARITPCLENGKTAFVDFLEHDQVGCGSTEFIVLRPKAPLPPFFGYFLARDPEFRAFAITNMSGTSGRQRVPSNCFANYKLVIPGERISVAFGQRVGAFMQQLKFNDEQSSVLAATRDTLLPKLLAEEIRVKDAEKFVENKACLIVTGSCAFSGILSYLRKKTAD
ncbi:MAG: restriction endonuclease subunit S [Deltaproteobacteria bacterium]|nr:restriction endonuclease subunit S [Deltaproteobacteria bacterium]